jgi:sulfide:quinone oxidoreductase
MAGAQLPLPQAAEVGSGTMRSRFVVLGAGFGGLELAVTLSEALGPEADVTLIDRSDAFVFGYAKLDVMFGRATMAEVRLPYAQVALPGVRLLRETVVAIDPETRTVTTDRGVHEAEHLVVALGADYDVAATPGLRGGRDEFYSPAGAETIAKELPSFTRGRAVVGVCGAPFKCPPAPSECALLLHDYLAARGRRDDCEIVFAIPFQTPVPPSPETSEALVEAFTERDIRLLPGRRVAALDTEAGVATLDDGSELAYDLFLGVPKHRAPDVLVESGMTEDGFVPVNGRTLETRWPDVYAVGDVATIGVPKAGVFAEGAARVVAASLLHRLDAGDEPQPFDGRGSCYVEFGGGRVGRVDVDFFGGERPTGTYHSPTEAFVAEKQRFGSSRRARWFGG